MDSPSWADVFHSAFNSCLHCFQAPSVDSDSESVHRPPRYLESLLTEPLLDTDAEAETVSLHSNVGDNRRRRSRKQKQKKQITFFGFDLFGKRSTGPIHLPEDDDEEVDELLRRSRRQRQRTTRISSSSSPSTITFDGNVSDAAPLDSAAIDERVIEEEELRAVKTREKDERRKRRKERKEMKKLARVLMQNGGQGDFEGFQGSGGSNSHTPPPFQQGFLPSPNSDDFGPFRQAQTYADNRDEDEAADLDGSLYAARKPNDGGSSVSGGGSDSRRSPRGTSASHSDFSNPRSFAEDSVTSQPKKKKSKKSSASTSSSSKTKSSNSRSSASATSSEQTESLASPISSMSPASSQTTTLPSVAVDKPTLEFEGSGFPRSGFGIERSFPSPGLGFNGAPRNGVARGGAFLASRD
ncbi:hypothetical protein EV359DRAFT_61167 [Lentinula novae-zelandiae]|nr:hypothetical protein EV359DRAFT_61167 [Lentinula novae-zelandiae]